MDDKEIGLEELREMVIEILVSMVETMTTLKKVAMDNDVELFPNDEKKLGELLKEANDIVDTIDSVEES